MHQFPDILCSVRLTPGHCPTDKACRHITHGQEHVLQPPVVELMIQGNVNTAEGFLLLYVFDDGSAADTWHVSVQDAKNSALIQYGVKRTEWNDAY